MFREVDIFGQSFQFNLPSGKKTLTTSFGAFATIFVVILLLLYGGLQLQRLIQFGETVVTSSVKYSYYTMDDVFPDDIENL